MMISEVIRPIEKGISAVVERKSALTKALALPLAISLALIMPAYSTSAPISVIMLTAAISSVISFVIVPVAIHRTIILDEKAASFFSSVTFGKREGEYLVAVIVSILYFLPCAVFFLIPQFGDHIADVVGAYVISRISLMFPSVAIGEKMNAKESWRATENHQLMMFSVVFLFAKVFDILEWGMSKLGVPDIFVALFSLVFLVFLVSALSEAYKIITSEGKLPET